MRKILTVLLVLVLASTVVFANGSSESKSSAQSGQTLSVMLSEEPAQGDALVNALNRWAAETGNTIKLLVIPYEDQLTKFPLMAKNKDLPDLVATTRLGQLYPDEFEDITTFLDKSMFEQQALTLIGQSYTSKKYTTAPQQFTITCVFYNKDAFAKAGITAPTADNPWTLDQLYQNAKLLMEKGGVKYGIAMDGSRARYDNLMYMYGGSLVQADGSSFKVTVNSKENIQALQMFINWNNTVMPKAIWAGGTAENPADYFKNGDVGMYFSGTWNYNTFRNEIKGMQWGVMPSPVGPKGGSSILGGSGLGVPVHAKNNSLAKSFMQWFYQKDNFQKYLNDDKGLSSLVGVTYHPEDAQVVADYQVFQSEVPKMPMAFIVDESSNWRQFYDNEYRDALKQAVNGDLTAEQALTGFATMLSKKSGWPLAY
jgi:alpha-1,4-digalacturonate transport system substrate-binding protein